MHNRASNPYGFAAELALVRDHVDPAQVGLYFDMGWAFCSEADPVAVITEFGPATGAAPPLGGDRGNLPRSS